MSLIPIDPNIRFDIARDATQGTPWPFDNDSAESLGDKCGMLVPLGGSTPNKLSVDAVYAGEVAETTDVLYVPTKRGDTVVLPDDVLTVTAEKLAGVWQEYTEGTRPRYSVQGVQQKPGMGYCLAQLVRA